VSGPILLTRAHRWRNGLPVFLTTAERDLNIVTPMQGEACYVDDNTAAEGLQTFSGTAWRPVAWNTSWGLINRVEVTANQLGIAAVADLTSLTITWTVVANRWYRTKVWGRVLQNTATGNNELIIADGSNTIHEFSTKQLGATGIDVHQPEVIKTISAGSTTRKARLQTSGGTTDLVASSIQPAWIAVWDDGPAGAPV
jgi:hypothetical protein